MTPKEITTLAGHRLLPPWVMKLVLEAVAVEREACAKVVESGVLGHGECAAAIRARGEK